MNSSPQLFLLYFVAIWIGVLFLFAHLGGWSRLAEKYCCDHQYTGSYKAWQGGQIGSTGYWGCGPWGYLWIAMTNEGMYIKTGPSFLYRVFHPPLFIPWSAVRSIEERKYWFMRVLEIKLNESDIKMLISASFLPEVQRFLGEKVKLTNKGLATN